MKKILNTSLKQKEKFLPIFVEMMKEEMLSGGKRYALSENKEFTDLICEIGCKDNEKQGTVWVLKQIIKYCGEIINCIMYDLDIPMADFPKIGVYSCIAMIKLWEFLGKKDIGEKTEEEYFTTEKYKVPPSEKKKINKIIPYVETGFDKVLKEEFDRGVIKKIEADARKMGLYERK